MGACATKPKVMKAEAADVPAPELPKEDTPAASTVEESTAATEIKEEASEKKAEGGDDAKQEEKAVEVDTPKEVESEESKTEVPAQIKPEAAVFEEKKKTEVVEQK